MKVFIKETGEQKTLSLIDPASRINYAVDFLANAGALNANEFMLASTCTHLRLEIAHDYSNFDGYLCSQEIYDYWVMVIVEHQTLVDRIYELAGQHGAEVYSVVFSASEESIDLEDYVWMVNTALDNVYGSPTNSW